MANDSSDSLSRETRVKILVFAGLALGAVGLGRAASHLDEPWNQIVDLLSIAFAAVAAIGLVRLQTGGGRRFLLALAGVAVLAGVIWMSLRC